MDQPGRTGGRDPADEVKRCQSVAIPSGLRQAMGVSGGGVPDTALFLNQHLSTRCKQTCAVLRRPFRFPDCAAPLLQDIHASERAEGECQDI